MMNSHNLKDNQTPNNNQQRQQQQYQNYDQSPNLNNSVRNDQKHLNYQLELIEGNLSRVCNQHDALMPLLQILEAMPQISKNEQEIKNIKNNQKALEQKLKNLESMVNQNSNQHVFGTIERNFKQQNSTIASIKASIKEIEQNQMHNQKVLDAKSKEEAQHVQRNVDAKIDKNKRDVQNILAEFKNSIQIELKKQEEYGGQYKNPSVINTNQGGENIGGDDYTNDIQNLYREIGMLRSELELLYDKDRRNLIFAQLDQEVPLSDTNEKELVVANLEQSVFFEELERFDRENQERLVYELNCLDDKLVNIQQQVQREPNNEQQNEAVKGEITYIEDRFFNLKQQIKGTKKKYLVDVRKLEDRLDNLIRMKDHILDSQGMNQRQSQGKSKSQVDHINKHMVIIKSYPDRVERLNKNIVENVANLQNRQKEIDEKLLSVHKAIQYNFGAQNWARPWGNFKNIEKKELEDVHVSKNLLYKQMPRITNKGRYGLYHGRVNKTGKQNTFSEKKTIRWWKVNVQYRTYKSEILQRNIRVPITTAAMKNMRKLGGFDNYILLSKSKEMYSPYGEYLRSLMLHKMNDPSWKVPYIIKSQPVKVGMTKKQLRFRGKETVWHPPEQRYIDLSHLRMKQPHELNKKELANLRELEELENKQEDISANHPLIKQISDEIEREMKILEPDRIQAMETLKNVKEKKYLKEILKYVEDGKKEFLNPPNIKK
ncbi:hypothetical protein PPERSA_00347 [Pseudocohnilembus persalinus]|uniref:Ribosomal protein L28/L24 n=1 Tax=Pseudocohnilembus persalinus TaxID=266149 RepID=A0A0V0QY61_PSEPJ|nr:hypothetical protein PPERSA_00347 [Pseudocohnilembus persalinus]|eukprot:KRX07190.1 hypothetical protein PPERSA_00347 [Pseudocohnilembus persalinus]